MRTVILDYYSDLLNLEYFLGFSLYRFSKNLLSFFQNVIDGDMCEQYNSLDPQKQKNIAIDLDRTPAEVSKKLEDIRTRYAF